MVNAQNYVFDLESVIAKVFPFRPTCSSYDSERKKNQNVSQKGPEKKVNTCGKLRLTAWVDFKEICFVIFIWNYHYSTQLNRTKGRN